MGLKKQVVNSAKWNTIATFFNMGLAFLKIAVLTRILERSDFGLVAIASVVIGFTSIFSDLGLTIAIIHKQDTTKEQYSSLYWTNVILSIVLYIVLLCATPLISSFYNEPILNEIVPLLGVEILANAFGKMFQTLKMKALDFKFISIVNVSSSVIGFVFTIILALSGWGIYSLVLGQLLTVIFVQVVYFISGCKTTQITFHLNFLEIKEYLSIGLYQLGARIIDYIAGKVDVFLIGHFWGMDALGVYNLAKDLLQKPCAILFKIVDSILTSAYAKIQNNARNMKIQYIRVSKMLSTFFIPVCVGFYVFADIIVKIAYGNVFHDAAAIMQALVLFEIINNIQKSANPIRTSLGRTDLSFVWALVTFVSTMAVVLIVKDTSILTLAWGLSVVNVITLIPYWRIALKRTIGIGFKDFMETFMPCFAMSLLIGGGIYLILGIWNTLLSNIVLFIVYLILLLSVFSVLDMNYVKQILSIRKS